MKILKKNIKENDVFHVNHKEYKYLDNHCFEGTLIARKNDEGEFCFRDTYWGSSDSYNKTFNFTEMMKKFDVKFYCNLDDLEPIDGKDKDYYEQEDVFRITNQHACSESCIKWFVKKGTKRSVKAMQLLIDEKKRELKSDIDFNIRRIEQLTQTEEKLKTGDTEVWI